MTTRSPFLSFCSNPRASTLLLALTIATGAVFTTGCGTGQPAAASVQSFTSVTVLLSSTLNDQLTNVYIAFGSVSLTSQSGKTVSLYNTSQSSGFLPEYEFVHLNGNAEPLTTAVIPQDVYTSATVTIAWGSNMTCVVNNTTVNPGGLEIFVNTPFTQVATPTSATVNMPASLTVTGSAIGIMLNMFLPQSALSACTNYRSVSAIPSFNLTPVTFASEATSSANGQEANLEGQVTLIDSANNTFTLVLFDGQTLSFQTNGGTVYQGVKGFSALTTGMFVDLDAAIQPQGTQLATRIAVEDTNITDLTVSTGPVLGAAASEPVLNALVRQQQGYLGPASPVPNLNTIEVPYDTTNSVYQISPQFANLQELPFPATFDAANVVGGQNVYVTTHAAALSDGPTFAPASTITLMPQTLNGTVAGVASSGAFQIYSVTLAPYDLLTVAATQSGQSSTLVNPNTVEVYVDGNTQLLNKQPLAAGSVFRFNGLLFNDAGTLRMDCGVVNDGVAE